MERQDNPPLKPTRSRKGPRVAPSLVRNSGLGSLFSMVAVAGLGSLIALAVWLFLYRDEDGVARRNGRDSPVSEAPEITAPEPAGDSGGSSGRSSKVSAQEEDPLPFGAPRLETYRAEAAQDPHGTPPSLLRFAERVAERQVQAMEDPFLRRPFFDELGRCARDSGNSLPPSVRAFCLARMETFAAKFPSPFRTEYEREYAPLFQTLPGNLAVKPKTRGTR